MNIIDPETPNQMNNKPRSLWLGMLFGGFIWGYILWCYFTSREGCIKHFGKGGFVENCGEDEKVGYIYLALLAFLGLLAFAVGFNDFIKKRKRAA